MRPATARPRPAILTRSAGGRVPLPGYAAPAASAARGPSVTEQLFLAFGLFVMQGAFLSILITTSDDERSDTGASDALHMAAFAVLLVITCIFTVRHFKAMRQGIASSGVFFLLPALAIVSTVWSVAPGLTLKRGILLTGVSMFDLYVAYRIGLDRLFSLTSKTVFVTAIASVAFALLLPTIGREIKEGLSGDWRGVFPQKNALGHVMSVGATVELLIMVRARRFKVGAILRFCLCTTLAALAHSASSLLAITLALVLAGGYVAFRRGLATGIVASIAGCALVALLVGIASLDASGGFSLLERDASLSGRTDLWEMIAGLVQQHGLFGWGFMAFWRADNPEVRYIQDVLRWDAPNAHNGYLDFALSLGLFGLAAYCLVMGWAVRRARLTLHREDLGAIVAILLAQFTIANLSESFMVDPSVFGWNLLTIVILKTGFALREAEPAPGAGRAPILLRARARDAVGG